RRAQILQFRLDQIGQLQIVEEEVEEFFAGQAEDEIILALPVGAAAVASTSGAAVRLTDNVANLVFTVPGQDEVALARVRAERERWLPQTFRPNTDIFAAIDLGDLAALQGLAHGFPNFG